MSCRILFAEDEKDARDVLAAILHQVGGHTVTTVADGDELLKKLEGKGADNYDLVVTDIQMERINGLAAAGIAHHFMNVRIPVIAVSGIRFTEKTRKLADITFSHVMTKPIDISALLDLVGSYSSAGSC